MKLAITILPFLFACATQPATGPGNEPPVSKREATRALSLATTMLENLDADHVRGVRPATGTVQYTEPCETAGEIDVDGTFETQDDGLASTFDITAGFAACSFDDEQLDGSVHWVETRNDDEYVATLDGTIEWHGVDGSATCTFDLEITWGPSGQSYRGTACGYDVEELEIGN